MELLLIKSKVPIENGKKREDLDIIATSVL